MPAGLPGDSVLNNNGNPNAGNFVTFDPLSGPKNSPFDAQMFDYSTGTPPGWNATTRLPIKINNTGSISTGALSTGIGFSAEVIVNALPVASAIFDAGFNDDGIPGERHTYDASPPAKRGSVASNTVDSTMMYIGGGRMIANVATPTAGRPFVPSPYTAGIAICGAGNGGSRDSGANTGFPMKMVTATGTVANGAAVEGSWNNRSGVALTIGQSTFGSGTAANAAPS